MRYNNARRFGWGLNEDRRFKVMTYLLCNIKVSAIFKKLNHMHDIDDFITQILSSKKFDELADILAEKAAKKILQLQGPTDTVKKFKARQETLESTIRNRHINEKKSKKELRTLIYPDDVVIKTTIPSNLNLNYKHLKEKEETKTISAIRPSNKKAERLKSDRTNKTNAQNVKKSVTEKSHARKIAVRDKRGDGSKYNNHKYSNSKRHRDTRNTSHSADDASRHGKKRQSKRRGQSSERSISDESQNGSEFKDILPQAKNRKNVRKNDRIHKLFSDSEEMEDRHSRAIQLRVHEDSDNNNVTSESFYSPYGQFERSSDNRRFVPRDQSFEDTTNKRTAYRPAHLDRNIRPPDYKDYEDMFK